MRFPNPKVFNAVLDAYIASRQRRWGSPVETIIWIAKTVTLQTYKGKDVKTGICYTIKTDYLDVLQKDKTQINKWMELVRHLNQLINEDPAVAITPYLEFIRNYIHTYIGKDDCIKAITEELVSLRKGLAEAKELKKSDDTIKLAIAEYEKLLDVVINFNYEQTVTKARSFYDSVVVLHDKRYANFDAFDREATNAEVRQDVREQEVKDEPFPALPSQPKLQSSSAAMNKKLFSKVVEDSETKSEATPEKSSNPETEAKATPDKSHKAKKIPLLAPISEATETAEPKPTKSHIIRLSRFKPADDTADTPQEDSLPRLRPRPRPVIHG